MYPEPEDHEFSTSFRTLIWATIIICVITILFRIVFDGKQAIAKAENARALQYVADHHCVIEDLYVSLEDATIKGVPYVCPNGQIIWIKKVR